MLYFRNSLQPHVQWAQRHPGIAPAACCANVMKIADVLRMLTKDGWLLVTTRGGHRQFKHATKPGRVTIAGKPSDELAPGTLNSIFKQAGLKK